MKKRFLGWTEIAFIALVLLVVTGVFVHTNIFAPLSIQDEWKEIRIPEGVTYSQGIDILVRNGIIKNRFFLIALSRLANIDRKLRAGYYNLNTSMSTWDIFTRLKKGMIIEYAVMIPEGASFEEIKEILKEKNLISDETWALVKDKDFIASLNVNAPSLEGYLYPDTYNLAKGTDPRNIFSMMVYRLRQAFDAALMKRAEELGMSENEALTLASIIEKEAMFNSERYLISSVYHNRLRKKMRLQADPTVVYGIKSLKLRITKKDLKKDTPYNTYIIFGLPPGPIASPGIRSIRAALYPADADYLYFVSKNDGTHYFSRTGEEHINAVLLYRQSINTSATSSPENKKDEQKTN